MKEFKNLKKKMPEQVKEVSELKSIWFIYFWGKEAKHINISD